MERKNGSSIDGMHMIFMPSQSYNTCVLPRWLRFSHQFFLYLSLLHQEAAGVEDAEVQIDETSRELRHVRKFAISLRENVASCLESAKALEASYSLSFENSVQISRSRREFWAAISTVLSGKVIHDDMISDGPNTRVLASAGLDITDPGGWLGHSTSFQEPVRVIFLSFSILLQ
jgi:hypothetical protein